MATDPLEGEYSSSSVDPPTKGIPPVHAFWQNGAGPSQVPAPTLTKRKRRKAEETSSQAKLLGLNGTAWTIGKVDGGASLSEISDAGSARGKGRRREGEEPEAKDMAKRARQASAAAKKALQEREKEIRSGADEAESGAVPGHDPATIGSTNPSPGKRKRGRPRKSQQPESQPSPPAPMQTRPLNGHSPSSPSDVVITGHRPLPDRPPHHFFSRTVSTSAQGASHDPVSVERPPHTGPRKLAFASDHKPTHSFFLKSTGVPKQADVTARSLMPEMNPFLNGDSEKSDAPGRIREGWGRNLKEETLPRAPLPGGDWPDHHHDVAGPSDIPNKTLHKRKPRIMKDRSIEEDTGYWKHMLGRAISPKKQRSREVDRVRNAGPPPLCQLHAAFTALSRKTVHNTRDTWCERYRPVQAEAVLGNEIEAVYLRNWLSALQVGGGRKVMRKIKRPKQQLFDGWIVDDIGLFGDAEDAEDEENEDELPEPYEEPELPLGVRPDVYPPLSMRLANTILLTGPHGSGKSAAVYAVATELGWEVFEVYPGIGKRTGANLMSLVGDVGKNHMVVKGGAKDEAELNGPIKSFFTEAEDRVVLVPDASQDCAAEPIEVDNDQANDPVEAGVRQSLILIEEADILFAEENTFWPAVISLIEDSRRPVIITCNDPRLVPRSQLPLQATLHFGPPPSYLAIPYLEAIASREGCLETAGLPALYAKSIYRPSISLDQPLPPNGHEPIPYFDLRLAINKIQLERHGVIPSSPERSHVEEDLAGVQSRLDKLSFSDAFCTPRSWAILEASEVDRFGTSLDDDLGVSSLVKPELADSCPVFPPYDQAQDIATEMTGLEIESLVGGEDLQQARIRYIRSLLPVLDSLIPLSAYLLPHSSLFTDYIPVIQDIVAADDVMEAAEEAEVELGGNRVNRKTGRPKRITAGLLGPEGYERYFDLSIEGLNGVRASVLHCQH